MQEINFIRPQEVYDRNTGESKVRYRSYDGNDRFIPVVDGEKGVPKTMVEVTHAELKTMRDNGKLTAGALYRITDYQCTTTQENTRSAGHQFDIVLLALSENKLAEEGWAMEHPTDVYDVTFGDGVTKKCYLNILNQNLAYIIDVATSLGTDVYTVNIDEYSELKTDEENKTAIASIPSEFLTQENLPYNYFQNSNLSAWKVWYCLDNDKSRFAWADDSVDNGNIGNLTYYDNIGHMEYECVRYAESDEVVNNIKYYGWRYYDSGSYSEWFTTDETQVNSNLFYKDGNNFIEENGVRVVTYVAPTIGTGLPNGRGVIYRLIDEWGNDVPYDFKNILYLRQLTNGEIDAQGSDTYIPTFCLYDVENGEYKDASIFAINYYDDEGKVTPCFNNFIGSIIANKSSIDSGAYTLPLTVWLDKVENNDDAYIVRNNIVYEAFNCNIVNATANLIILYGSNRTFLGHSNTIIVQDKRVVWEDIS